MRLKSGQLDKNRDMLGGELNNCPFCYHGRAKKCRVSRNGAIGPQGLGRRYGE
jgi:hypothetical protein